MSVSGNTFEQNSNSNKSTPTMSPADAVNRRPSDGAHTTRRDSAALAADAPPSYAQGTPFHHVAAVTVAYLRLRTRARVATVLEIIIVPLFVLALVISWLNTARDELPTYQFVSNETTPRIWTPEADLWGHLCRADDAMLFAAPAAAARIPRCANTTSTVGFNATVPRCFDADGFGRLCFPGGEDALQGFLRNASTFDRPRYVADFDNAALARAVAHATLPNSRRRYRTPLAALGNGVRLHRIASPAASAFDTYLMNATSTYALVRGREFASLSDAKDFIDEEANHMTTWCVLQVGPLRPDTEDITPHCNQSGLPETDPEDVEAAPGLAGQPSKLYLSSGFLTLQRTFHRFFLRRVLNVSVDSPLLAEGDNAVVSMPVPGGIDEAFLQLIGDVMGPLIIMFGFMFNVAQTVRRIVGEKESRVRESMLIAGLSSPSIFVGWFISEIPANVLMALIIAMEFKLSMLARTDFGLIFAAFLMGNTSITVFSGFLASFFSRTRLASMIAPVAFFFAMIPSISLGPDAERGVIYGMSWSVSVMMKTSLKLFFGAEAAGRGFSTADVDSPRDKVNFNTNMMITGIVIGIYFVLMMYFDAVISTPFGRRKSMLFFITEPIAAISRCFRRLCGSSEHEGETVVDGRDPNGAFEDREDDIVHAPKSMVQLRGLTRKFVDSLGKEFVAVNGLCLDMRPGEITALLGPNGAGKSTTYNILTGLIDATGGRASVFGHDVTGELGAVRSQLAYCPQHNVLWEDLTAIEHLRFIGVSRGIWNVEERALEMLTDVDLMEKKDCAAGGLSGGQKRKLSIAMAFMADAKLALLDEPTAGCDVSARRHIWGAIRKQAKAGRVIVLSTHFLEEAEGLGDYIAILCRGRLKASGSSAFLKGRLGVGYDLVVSTPERMGTAPASAVAKLVKAYIPVAKTSTAPGEVHAHIPAAAVPALPDVLRALEAVYCADAEDEGAIASTAASNDGAIVTGFGVGATTLESVFMTVVEADELEAEAEAKAEREQSPPSEATRDAPVAVPQGGTPRNGTSADENDEDAPMWHDDEVGSGSNACAQMFPLLRKRWIYIRRDLRTCCLQTIVPVIAATLAMLFGLIGIGEGKYVRMTPDMFPVLPTETAAINCSAAVRSQLAWRPQTTIIDPSWPNATTSVTMPSLQMANWLLDDHDHHEHERISSFACDDRTLLPRAATTVFVNESYAHAAPIALYQIHAATTRAFLNSSTFDIVIGSAPLPATDLEKKLQGTIFAVVIALFIILPFAIIPSTFVSFTVREREEGSKMLQLVSGVSLPIYWISHAIFDILTYAVTTTLVFLIFLAFGRDEYIGSSANLQASALLFGLYGVTACAAAYVVGFLFKSHGSAQNTTLIFNFLLGFLLTTMIYFFANSEPEITDAFRYVFRLFPVYALADGLLGLAELELTRAERPGEYISPWGMDTIGWDCLYLALELPLFILALFLIERPKSAMLYKREPADASTIPEDEHPDVRAERERVANGGDATANDIVVVDGLRKVYAPSHVGAKEVVAVNNLTFGVRRGQVFGFLGSNGAGKTTTLNVVSARDDAVPTAGVVSVNGHDPVLDPRAVHRSIGLCPQFDIVFSLLTTTENLRLVAGLRGVPLLKREAVIDRLIAAVGLTQHRDKLAGTLSGGNRRKLSLAVSLVGGPELVLLDEPTAGIDTVARRRLWSVISRLAKQSTVVLTTHHLAEVDHLANRVGIMVSGELKCIGALQRLKEQFGDGFTLTITVAPGVEEPAATAFVKRVAEGAELRERRGRTLTFLLPPENTRLSTLFADLERATKHTAARGHVHAELDEPEDRDGAAQASLSRRRNHEPLATPTSPPPPGAIAVAMRRGHHGDCDDENEQELTAITDDVEALAAAAGIVDYTVAQASVEDVFLRVVANEEEHAAAHNASA